MANVTFTGNIQGNECTIQRINRQKAKRLFNEGKTIYMQSSNFHPFGYWSTVYVCHPDNDENKEGFESVCNSFEFYNCTNETGKYIHFYIKIN